MTLPNGRPRLMTSFSVQLPSGRLQMWTTRPGKGFLWGNLDKENALHITIGSLTRSCCNRCQYSPRIVTWSHNPAYKHNMHCKTKQVGVLSLVIMTVYIQEFRSMTFEHAWHCSPFVSNPCILLSIANHCSGC